MRRPGPAEPRLGFPVVLPLPKLPEQELFVLRREVEPLAGLLDDRGRPGSLFSEPRDGAAQSVSSWHERTNRHGLPQLGQPVRPTRLVGGKTRRIHPTCLNAERVHESSRSDAHPGSRGRGMCVRREMEEIAVDGDSWKENVWQTNPF